MQKDSGRKSIGWMGCAGIGLLPETLVVMERLELMGALDLPIELHGSYPEARYQQDRKSIIFAGIADAYVRIIYGLSQPGSTSDRDLLNTPESGEPR